MYNITINMVVGKVNELLYLLNMEGILSLVTNLEPLKILMLI